MILLMLICLSVLEASHAAGGDNTDTCSDRFSCEYHMLLKVVELEQNAAQQDEKIASLTQELHGELFSFI